MEQALHWVLKDETSQAVQCLLCPHVCVIANGEPGLCRTRKNDNGKLYAVNYGLVTAAALDPVEKKPLKKYMPGKKVFSLGTFGCNLACGYCQNWQIAHQDNPISEFLSPADAVAQAKNLTSYGNIGIAYTYSEPLMWYEYVLKTAELARAEGLKNILVTNGYLNPRPLKRLVTLIDAVNLDIKGFSGRFYHDVCKGKLEPVLRSARLFASECHLEITTLVVPTLNDDFSELTALAEWIARLNKKIPLHLTRYFPSYRMTIPPTPLATLIKARELISGILDNVYLGNV